MVLFFVICPTPQFYNKNYIFYIYIHIQTYTYVLYTVYEDSNLTFLLCSFSDQSYERDGDGHESQQKQLESQRKPPDPNNPMEYCSRVPPPQQAAAIATAPPPTVMVPVGVLKREGEKSLLLLFVLLFSFFFFS